jgi:hypothetical protein
MKTVCVPVSGKCILATRISSLFVMGENIPERVIFQIQAEVPQYCYLMYKRTGDSVPFIISLDKTFEDGVTSLEWKPTLHFCAKKGIVRMQIVACDIPDPSEVTEDDVVQLTKIASVDIAESFVDPENPEPMESIFTEYLSQFEDLLDETKQARDDAKDYADKAKDYANDAKGYAHDAEQALSSLTARVNDLEIPAIITNEEIDDIFEED